MRLPYINNIIDVQRSYQSLLRRQPYKKSRGAHARLREMARPEKSQMTSGEHKCKSGKVPGTNADTNKNGNVDRSKYF